MIKIRKPKSKNRLPVNEDLSKTTINRKINKRKRHGLTDIANSVLQIKARRYEDLKKIYNVSKQSFTRNPFYTPIEEEDFLKQYEQYVTMCDKELIMIAEKDGEEVGFVFCVPNFNEAKEGKKIQTLILKTIAVLPEYEYLAIGNVLLNRISKVAENKGFLKWIFANCPCQTACVM